MNPNFLKSLLAPCLLVFSLAATAEDIDLFMGTAPPDSSQVPNVLIIVDNSANWSSAFTNEMAALSATVSALPTDKFRVGIMFASEAGGSNTGEKGGYVRAAIRLADSGNKTKYQALINSFHKSGDAGNGGISSLVMAEAYRYLSGGVPYAGNQKVKTDYLGNTSGTAQSNAVYALTGNALGSINGTPYVSPITSSCQRTFIIYISNGAANDNNSVTTQANSMLTAAGGLTTPIPISPSGSQDNPSDEWARFMKKSSQEITTYTIDIDKVTSGQGQGWTALLKSMAGVGGGRYFDVSSSVDVGAQISAALGAIFSEIQAVNSVFASVSLPVSVNTQGMFLNQVFIGMFRPDRDAYPRWAGNLKQYKIGFNNTNALSLLDADDRGAINSSTGFITECARSFWTPTTTDNYWSNKPQGSCITGSNLLISNPSNYDYQISNAPDGNVVEKGAQAYWLRNTTSRTVKTCSAAFASCTSLTDFNTINVTQAMLGAANSAEQTALVNWAKGLDVNDENIDGVTTTEMRQSVHGDVIHSRPVAINFGTDAVPEVVVFYGGNDGVLRAINGNRSSSLGLVPAGGELWSFVAPEFFSKIKRLRDNATQISFKGNTVGSALPKPYGVDGPITGFQGNIGVVAKTFIYATMRRGGRVLYAFDVTTPASPVLKWKKGCPNAGDDTDCTTDFSGIGQTWSSPKILNSSGYGSGAKPILIMGGGYDPCEDADNGTANHNCTSFTKGNKIYVLDADTGVLLKTLDTVRGVVGDLTVVPDSTTGMAKYAYAADLGGNVYRVNIGTVHPSDWTITTIASLGCDTVGSCNANRKFMFGPDVVVESSGINYLMLGSGDREKPLSAWIASTGVANHFFMIKDKPTDSAWLSSQSLTCSVSVICKNSLTPIVTGATPAQSTLDASKGWYLGMSSSEQVVTSAITLFGVVTFSSHQPAVSVAGSCGSNLGTANVYNIRYLDAASTNGTSSRFELVSGGGLSASPVIVMTTTDSTTSADGTVQPGVLVTGVLGASPKGATEIKECKGIGCGSSTGRGINLKSRVYWYIQQ